MASLGPLCSPETGAAPSTSLLPTRGNGSVKGPTDTSNQHCSGLKHSLDNGNVRAVNDAGVSSDSLKSRVDDVTTGGDPPVPPGNNEACGLQVSLLSHREMGGKEKITLLKTRKEKRQIVLLPKLNCSCLGGTVHSLSTCQHSAPQMCKTLARRWGLKAPNHLNQI